MDEEQLRERLINIEEPNAANELNLEDEHRLLDQGFGNRTLNGEEIRTGNRGDRVNIRQNERAENARLQNEENFITSTPISPIRASRNQYNLHARNQGAPRASRPRDARGRFLRMPSNVQEGNFANQNANINPAHQSNFGQGGSSNEAGREGVTHHQQARANHSHASTQSQQQFELQAPIQQQPQFGLQAPMQQQPQFGFQAPVQQQPQFGLQAPVQQQPQLAPGQQQLQFGFHASVQRQQQFGWQPPVQQQAQFGMHPIFPIPAYGYQIPAQNPGQFFSNPGQGTIPIRDANGRHRVDKWLLTMNSRFILQVEYQPGKKNIIADLLSRSGALASKEVSDESSIPPANEIAHIEEIREGDEPDSGGEIVSEQRKEWILKTKEGELGFIYEFLESKTVPKEPKEQQKLMSSLHKFALIEGLLYRHGEDGKAHLFVPRPFREKMIRERHSGTCAGHLSGKKIFKQLAEGYFWPNMYGDCIRAAFCCRVCAHARKPRANEPPLNVVKTSEPLELVCIDILSIGPANSSNHYILVAVDHFTKYLVANPIPDKSAETVARNFVKKFILVLGTPKRLHSDKGKEFVNETLTEIASTLKIERSTTAGYDPQANGVTERVNQTIIGMLRRSTTSAWEWDDRLPYIVFAYNTTPSETTGFSPHYLMFGKPANFPLEKEISLLKNPLYTVDQDTYIQLFRESLHQLIEEARKNSEVARRKMKERYDAQPKVTAAKFGIGDRVMIIVPGAHARSPHRKILWNHFGPFVVKQITKSAGIVVPADKLNAEPLTVPLERLVRVPPGITNVCTMPKGKNPYKNILNGLISAVALKSQLKIRDSFLATQGRAPSQFVMLTDASKIGIAAILCQPDEVGHLRPIYFASRQCNRHESRYCPTELEALAIRFVEYQPGKKNIIADLLSRSGALASKEVSDESSIPPANEIAHIEEIREGDEPDSGGEIVSEQRKEWILKTKEGELGFIYEFLESKTVPKEPKEQQKLMSSLHKFALIEEKMIRERHSGTCAGHLSGKKIFKQLAEGYFWPNMYGDCIRAAFCCRVCAHARKPRANEPPLNVVKTSEPLELVCIDILSIGPANSSNHYILVAVDHFTKYLVANPIPDKSAETVARNFVKKFILVLGTPKRLHSDKGKEFVNETLTEIASTLKIERSTTAGYDPQANGVTERVNQTIIGMLRRSTTSAWEWDDRLPYIVFAYNTTPSETTGFSPHYLMFGKPANFPLEKEISLLKNPLYTVDQDTYIQLFRESLHQLIEEARKNSEVARRKMKERYDAQPKVTAAKFGIGDRVMIIVPGAHARSPHRKILWNHFGPFVVKQITKSAGIVVPADKLNAEPLTVPLERLVRVPPGITNVCTMPKGKNPYKNILNGLISAVALKSQLKIRDSFLATQGRAPSQFVMLTDASKIGIAAILCQPDEVGHLRPIYFASRQCNRHESRYCPTELEALAIRFVEYQPEKKNIIADLLSRSGALASKEVSDESSIPPANEIAHIEEIREGDEPDSEGEIVSEQRKEWILKTKEGELGFIYEFLESKTVPKEPKEQQKLMSSLHKFALIEGLLYRHGEDGKAHLFVPRPFREKMIRERHSGTCAGHLSGKKIFKQLAEGYFWPNMYGDCIRAAFCCRVCAHARKPRANEPPLNVVKTSEPLELVCIDILSIGPVNSSNHYILVAVDHFTKYLVANPIPDKSAETVARNFVKKFILVLGTPKRLHSDKGKEFVNETLTEIASTLKIERSTTAGYDPQANGVTERVNQTIIGMLRRSTTSAWEWDDRLPYIVFAYNTTPSETTGNIPFKKPLYTVDQDTYIQLFRESLHQLIEEARKNSEVARRKMKERYDAQPKVTAAKFGIGDRVMIIVPWAHAYHRTAKYCGTISAHSSAAALIDRESNRGEDEQMDADGEQETEREGKAADVLSLGTEDGMEEKRSAPNSALWEVTCSGENHKSCTPLVVADLDAVLDRSGIGIKAIDNPLKALMTTFLFNADAGWEMATYCGAREDDVKSGAFTSERDVEDTLREWLDHCHVAREEVKKSGFGPFAMEIPEALITLPEAEREGMRKVFESVPFILERVRSMIVFKRPNFVTEARVLLGDSNALQLKKLWAKSAFVGVQEGPIAEVIRNR
uniref:RNA-directed DNA polymerase n=1 Tax=Globodera rostochiensis TaxID=31243 RepID=A0A914H3J3_GLORO